MNRNQWNAFFQIVFGPVYYQGQSYVDMSLISKAEFPALAMLEDLNILELLLLAWLINLDSILYQDDTWTRLDDVAEIFENYEYDEGALEQACCTLVNKGFAHLSGSIVKGVLHVRANSIPLRQAGVFTSDYDSIFQATHEDKNPLFAKCLLQ